MIFVKFIPLCYIIKIDIPAGVNHYKFDIEI
jgi:hypothetical protein